METLHEPVLQADSALMHCGFFMCIIVCNPFSLFCGACVSMSSVVSVFVAHVSLDKLSDFVT